MYTRTGDLTVHDRYVRCRNDLRRLTRNLRVDFERTLVRDIKENPKAFWRYSNSRLKAKSKVGDLRQPDGTLASTGPEKAEVLNTYFCSVFTVEDRVLPDTVHVYTGAPLSTVVIETAEVERKLHNLNPCSAPGPDGLHPRLMRETASALAPPLAALFRRSMHLGAIPDEWRAGEVTPIFKKGSRQVPANYRPVSLTSVACKVLESIVRDKIFDHLTSSHLLHDSQHGFRPLRSCDTQLLVTIDHWSRAIDAGEPVDAIYLDFRKAFDSVPHRRLLSKLQACGISGKLLQWIQAFLCDRRQRVVVEGHKSSWVSVTSGVPQGSVLGPLLFLLFVNDLPETISSCIQLFADDAKLYRPVSNPSDSRDLQQDLDALAAWSSRWQLAFNESKCKSLHFGRANQCLHYSMGGVPLDQSTVERDLGVMVDVELKFRQHAAAAVAKASQVLAVIRRSFGLLDKTTLPLLYKSLVRPHLEYGNIIWGPFGRADQKLVERVQRRATKLVAEIRALSYPERLQSLGLPSLYYRRRRGDMIMTYKIIHGRVDLNPDVFFTPALMQATRGHPWKLDKPRAHSRIRRNAFCVRSINDWNALPLEVVASETLAQFKSRLDAHWNHLHHFIPAQD